MNKKGLIMIAIGVAIAILVTGGLVVASSVGGKGCATEGVRGQAAGDARIANVQGAGNSTSTCDGDCATCENQECVKNQGAESTLSNAFKNANGTCDGTCEGSGNETGTCDGTGAGQGNGSRGQGMTCPMR